jgi:nitrogenase molybdenum-iron protein alpha/beta subunit
MKGLYKVLPPFAADYSGACSVLFELGGISVIQDAAGCTGNFVGYDEPRCYGSSAAIFTSELREIDAVLGDNKKLIAKIEQAVRVLDKQFVAILGSPAPMVIGTDYKAIATLLAKKINMPVLSFDTNGIDYYDKGASVAFLELAHKFVRPEVAAKGLSVNIIGATPLDIGKNEQAERLISLIENAGLVVQSCWSMGSTLDDIAGAAQANANIVVSWSGLKVARYMQTKFGIPYLVGLPVGARAGRQLINNLLNLVGLENKAETADIADFAVLNIDSNVLVIGEQVKSNSIRDCLRMDIGIINVDVVSFFSMEEELTEGEDMHIGSEEDLGDLINDGKYDIVIGDPLYKDLALASNKSNFIDFPHAAVSSRLHREKEPDYIGSAGSEFLRKVMGI